MTSRRNEQWCKGPKPPNHAGSAAGIFALVLAAACTRGADTGEEPAAVANESPTDARLAPARAAIDRVSVTLEALVVAAGSANGDRALLVPIAAQLTQALQQGQAELGPLTKKLSDDDQRALQHYYGLRIAPVLSRLQVLVFPAHMIALPAGATPAALAHPATAG